MTGVIIVAILLVAGMLFLIGRNIAFKGRCSAIGTAKLLYLDEVEAKGGGKAGAGRAIVNERGIIYIPIYEYEVDNMIYHIRPEKESRDPNKFKHGEVCEIKYNPKKPSECTMGGKIARCTLEMEKSNEKEIYERIRRGNI